MPGIATPSTSPIGATKATMGMVGVIVGPTRLPNGLLTGALRGELDALGFFDWIKT